MKEVGRRTVLKWGLGAGALWLLGCGGSDESPTPGASPAWVVSSPSFAVGSGAAFNLANTLPAGVARGGSFGVSPSGAQLPAGMTLTSAGILSVGTAAVGSVAGVVFTYATP
jgi:hypothetical protein